MNLNLDFKVQREQKVKEIEDSLQNYLPEQKGYQKIIMEAMGYSLLAGGKRLRPMLMRKLILYSAVTQKQLSHLWQRLR